ncbi:hypothetical protein Tco_0580777 [Tanacetum coccineum]
MIDTLGVAINSLRTRIDNTLLEDRQRRWMPDSQNSLREFYKTNIILMSAYLSKNLKELKEELIVEVHEMLNIFESMEQKVDEKSSKENILQNEIDRLLEVSLTSEIRDRLSTLNDENVLLKTQVDSVIQERENIKLEFQKLFNSIKATQTQHQKEVDELIEHVNQKTYAYADVCAQNQDLLMIISELKDKLRTIDKAKNVNTKFDKSEASGTLLCVTPLPKNIAIKAKKVSNSKVNADRNSTVKRALFTTPVAAKSKNLRTTFVVAKSRLGVANIPKATNKVLQIVLWIVDSGCSKHMTGNLQLLRNFNQKFMGTVRFRNDYFAAITG